METKIGGYKSHLSFLQFPMFSSTYHLYLDTSLVLLFIFNDMYCTYRIYIYGKFNAQTFSVYVNVCDVVVWPE